MTTLLEKAIAQARRLPAGDQEELAELLMAYIGDAPGEDPQLSEDQLSELRRRLAEEHPHHLSLEEFEARMRDLRA